MIGVEVPVLSYVKVRDVLSLDRPTVMPAFASAVELSVLRQANRFAAGVLIASGVQFEMVVVPAFVVNVPASMSIGVGMPGTLNWYTSPGKRLPLKAMVSTWLSSETPVWVTWGCPIVGGGGVAV